MLEEKSVPCKNNEYRWWYYEYETNLEEGVHLNRRLRNA